nr:MAG TPA: Nrap protein domain 6 [Caudoviricetes sp.]
MSNLKGTIQLFCKELNSSFQEFLLFFIVL